MASPTLIAGATPALAAAKTPGLYLVLIRCLIFNPRSIRIMNIVAEMRHVSNLTATKLTTPASPAVHSIGTPQGLPGEHSII